MGDVTRPVTLDVEFGGVVDSPLDQKKHTGLEATGQIRRSDFGLDLAPGLLGDLIKIHLDMPFVAGPERLTEDVHRHSCGAGDAGRTHVR
ncbi:YceI family protein [Streptomyces sp. NPDC005329]|uniref:YceI family protein n=1 Tax=Streptomyces sp. NPDC005329 TaxID=3157034 RepID=UPI0033BCDA46